MIKVVDIYSFGGFVAYEMENGIDVLLAPKEIEEVKYNDEEFLFRGSNNKLYSPVKEDDGCIIGFNLYRK